MSLVRMRNLLMCFIILFILSFCLEINGTPSFIKKEKRGRSLEGSKAQLEKSAREIELKLKNKKSRKTKEREYIFSVREKIKFNRSKNFNLPKLSSSSFLSLSSKTKVYMYDDDPINFFMSQYESDYRRLPMKGEADRKAWSGSYWPMRNLMIASRYGFREDNNIGGWDAKTGEFYEYTYQESAQKINQPGDYFSQLSQGNVVCKDWSPSEKYDILVGDVDFFTLTNKMKSETKKYEKNGDIPSWYGLCHGWSPASYWFPEPRKPVTLTAADHDETDIHFYPDDIKALLTLYFANSHYETRFIGTSCPYKNEADIPKDPATGLYMDYQCSSIDPGAMIVTLANQIGIKHKNMIIDPHQDSEIWNQPVNKYSLRWYLLTDSLAYENLLDNLISLQELRGHPKPFLNFLWDYSPSNAVYALGVELKIDYSLEYTAQQSDFPDETFTQENTYIAGLYLDEGYRIIGGKWKYNFHPQFAWKPFEGVQPQGVNDDKCLNFDGSVESLRSITEYAKQASLKMLPMKCIIEYLSYMSSH